MSLFVPVLRLAMLFLNVWDAYKTLKPPPPSLRDPTRPSVRASTQRKRDMKGVLAVWICSFAAYERLVESFVSLFIPFYDEFKSMFMLFLILTRARGAEPIFLHIIRPLIKPYTSTLDGIFDLLRHIGDFLFALSSFPVHLAIARWHRWRNPPEEPDVSIIEESDSETTTGSSSQAYSVAPSASSRITRNHNRDAAQHEIWVPPQSSHDEEEEEEAFDAPPEILELTLEEKAVEEWSKYPAFPSAYPASPTTTHSFLESASSFSQSLAEASVAAQSTQMYGASQGFQRSLLSARSRQNPGYGRQGGSDQRSASGIQIHQRSMASSSSTTTLNRTNSGSATAVQPSHYDEVEDEMDEDHDHEEEYDHYDRDALLSPGPYKSNASYSGSEVDYDEEDSFNMTLRTPLPPHGAARSRALMARLTIPLPLGSANSMNSNSTALPSARTTASTLRTGSDGGLSDDAGSLGPSPVGYGYGGDDAGADGLGLLIGGGGNSEDLEKTVTGRTRGTGARKRKAAAVSISGLQELTEGSDAGDGLDDDEEDANADADGDGDAEMDADGDAAMEDVEGESKKGGGQAVKPEVKRRRVGASPPNLRKAGSTANGGATAKAGVGIQPRAGAVPRKPLAAKPAANSSSASAASTKGASVKGSGAKVNGSTPSLSSASASAGLAKKSGTGGAHMPVRAQGRAGAGAGAAAKGAVVNGKGGLPGKKGATTTTVTLGTKQVRAAASGSSTGSST
ncbi:hypothetical protein D9611_013891 [Ephemerocybe angulata]|uniref:Protein YOP1 n=1 Tax=Ephemerocybe angulata TaxID=980116 RepID=A0A8H5FAC9_9AGAR|nr:hypothetical protein D9611_013891 [Tulosesus angulatus]